jgi:amino acid transporter
MRKKVGGVAMAISRFLEESRVNVALAILAVIFVFLAVVVAIAGAVVAVQEMASGRIPVGGGGLIALTLVFGILGAIFQLIVLYQWSSAMNQNVKNTEQVLTSIKERLEDPLRGEVGFFLNRVEEYKVITWPFWVYLVMYIIGLFTGWYAFLFNLIGFIFVAVYLSSIFKSTNKLSDLKDRIYQYLQEKKGITLPERIHRIKRYNIILFIILSVITFAIYWLYLLIKLSLEINRYLESDEKVRTQLEEAFTR